MVRVRVNCMVTVSVRISFTVTFVSVRVIQVAILPCKVL